MTEVSFLGRERRVQGQLLLLPGGESGVDLAGRWDGGRHLLPDLLETSERLLRAAT